MPVVDDDDRLVGLVSERDLLRRAAGLEGDVPLSVSDDISTSARVREVMTWHVETIEADDDVATAAAVMLDNKYGCLPVLEQGRAGRDPDRSGFRAARRGACGRRRSAARPRAFEGLRRDGVEQHS